MVVKCAEELQVYQKAISTADAVSALTERQTFNADCDLRNQLRSSSAGIPAHISEGFSQKTDRHFAHYLYIARGTTHEVRTHMRIALGRRYVTEAERNETDRRYDEIARMLTGLFATCSKATAENEVEQSTVVRRQSAESRKRTRETCRLMAVQLLTVD